MRIRLIFTISACFFILNLWSQSGFQKISDIVLPELAGKKYQKPQKEEYYTLNYETLVKTISSNARAKTRISLPIGNGKMKEFEVQETFMMEEQLAKKYPSIKTYKGVSADGTMMVNFDLGPYGLHASIIGSEGDMYIEPVTNEDKNHYYFYLGKDQIEEDEHVYSCGTTHEGKDQVSVSRDKIASLRSTSFDLLEYRLAIACTGEWGALRGTKEKALADIVTTVNRLNQIFEMDLGILVKLIARNDELIFLDPAADPFFVADNGKTLVEQNTGILNSIVGVASYDFGHVYTNRCNDVGGIASVSSVCSGVKGGGVSCFSGNIIGTTNRIVAHEMGHQFGAEHTFNNCGENIKVGNDFEPGSGSTIMSYAGGPCGDNTLIATPDSYYHNASLVQIYNYMRDPMARGNGCANKILNENVSPVINNMPSSGLTLPISTPFMLEGSASDDNFSDQLTYCWEQKDAGLVSAPLGFPFDNTPLFRSYIPNEKSYRLFPNSEDLLSGTSSIAEVLPFYKRSMNFAFTVRDNNPEAGASVWEFVKFEVTDQAGPFLITSPNNNIAITGGDKMDIKWDVANTDQAPVNCKTVDIFLHILGDLDPANFVPVALSVPNTGTAKVTIPDTVTTSARFIVKASENVFFDLSNVYFPVNKTTKPGYTFLVTAEGRDFCLPASTKINIQTATIAQFDGSVRLEFEGLPEGMQITSSKDSIIAGEDASLDVTMTNEIPTGKYQITILAISDALGDTTTSIVEYEVTSTSFVGLNPLTPTNGTQNLEGLPFFTWAPATNTDIYTLEVSNTPTFDSLVVNVQVADTARASTKFLEKSSLYFWRVKSANTCGTSTYSPVQVFGTETLACKNYEAKDLPINITQSGKPTIESKVIIADNFNIVDLNVKSISIDHDNFKDLKATLVSPLDKSVVLFNSQCPRRMNLNFGFDNDAPSIFTCATTPDTKYKPTETLDIFNNDASNGTWKLIIEDVVSGSGGSLKGFSLELCGNIEVTRPVVSLQEILVAHKKAAVITADALSTISTGTAPEKLTYTILSLTAQGKISKAGLFLNVGDVFTQADVNAGIIIYENAGPELSEGGSALDFLEMIVENDASGWEGSFALTFNIQNIPTSLYEYQVESLKIFPNPADNQISIVLPESMVGKSMTYTVFGLDGRQVSNGVLSSSQNNLDISRQESGYYIIQVTADQKKYIGKYIKI